MISQSTQRLAALLTAVSLATPAFAEETPKEPAEKLALPIGAYETTTPAGKPLGVHYCVPRETDSDSPILIVIPGARRNAGEYRDQWADLATHNRFVLVVPEASLEAFPTEYEYNAGGVTDPGGRKLPEREWLFSAIEPMFDEFRERIGSERESFSLYGHSAGGGFVHRYLLMKPEAPVDRAVAANPAFFTFPEHGRDYPFALDNLSVWEFGITQWFAKPLTILLGARDTGPRTKELSNSSEAKLQGPSVFARGLGFFHNAMVRADLLKIPLAWKIEIVQDVGHSNTHMASHAVEHLFGDP